jgi:hypothetical protein
MGAQLRTFDIVPLNGVGPVKLGMTRNEVRSALGESPDGPILDNREGFMRGFFVDYDDTGRVEFIELARSSFFRAVFRGHCLHDVPADEAIALVSKYDQFDATNKELGHSYIFLKLQLSLWRGTCATADQSLDDPDGRHFEAVGIAAPGYFERSGI